MDFPDGRKHAELAALRRDDERRRAQEIDLLTRQTGRADLIQSGVVSAPRVYTLMVVSNSGSGKSQDDSSLIIIKAAQRVMPDFLDKGSCADIYFQENEWFRSKQVKTVRKLAHVTYGGRDFSEGTFKFKEDGREHLATVSATCAEKYYLVFQFVGNSAAELNKISDVAKSIRFTSPVKDKE